MAAERDNPPITMPPPPEHWFYTREAVVRSLQTEARVEQIRDQALPRIGRDADRLQRDLSSHIAENLRDLQDLEGNVQTVTTDVNRFLAAQEETVIKPLNELVRLRTQWLGGWKVIALLMSVLGSLVGTVLGGVLVWKLTSGH